MKAFSKDELDKLGVRNQDCGSAGIRLSMMGSWGAGNALLLDTVAHDMDLHTFKKLIKSCAYNWSTFL